MKLLSKQEIERILDRVSTLNTNIYLRFSVLAYTGVRVSELICIRPVDLLMDERQIIIRGKGNVIRNVDVSPQILLPLRLYIKQKRIKNNQLIFPVTRDAIYKMCKKYAGVNPHVFRHSYAVELLRTTKNIRYVQKQLGHKDLQVTQIYLQFMDFTEDKKKLAELWQ